VSQLENRVRFILAVINKTLVVSNRPKADLIKELVREGYTPFRKSKKDKKGKDKEKAETKEEDEDDATDRDYDYLLGMKIWSLTKERVKKLQVRTLQLHLDPARNNSKRNKSP
jgi:DNA topoisomerase-2